MKTSATLTALAPALVKAAAELTNPAKTAENPFFKSRYTRLDKLIDHLRPVLAKHGLCAVQSAGDGVTTMIVHESGEWIASEPLHITPVKNDPQGVAGSITYARRYSLAAICGVEGEGDDDGNHASGNAGGQQRPQAAPPPQGQPPAQPPQAQGDVQPKKHDGEGFEMSHYPSKKGGVHVFESAAANNYPEGRWNGKTWEEMAKLHGSAVRSGSPADSPLVYLFTQGYCGGWVKEHAAYLAQQIDAITQPAADDVPDGFPDDDIPF